MTQAQATRLREILLDPVEVSALELAGAARAAVLVPLYERDGELCAVLTRRRDDLPRHAGQVAFPGGRSDPGDGDLIATALREAHEEIGLEPSAVTLLGALAPVSIPVSGFAVYPFVAAIERPTSWRPASGEVELVFELTLDELVAGHAHETRATPVGRLETPTFTAGKQTIWGATAFILADLLHRLGLLDAEYVR
ncbi:MAG: CoA pyrophosphatase [Solirubrobacteraceae bacterium]